MVVIVLLDVCSNVFGELNVVSSSCSMVGERLGVCVNCSYVCSVVGVSVCGDMRWFLNVVVSEVCGIMIKFLLFEIFDRVVCVGVWLIVGGVICGIDMLCICFIFIVFWWWCQLVGWLMWYVVLLNIEYYGFV